MTEYITSEHIREAIANTPQVVFETTDVCNLQCKYCLYGNLYSSYGERYGKFLNSRDVIPFLDYLIDIWESSQNHSTYNHKFISFYGGEPLLNPQFIKEVISYLQERNTPLNFSYTMTTNGILLDKYIDYLIEKDFDLLISLDGNSFNNSYRVHKNGKPSFDELIRNIKHIQHSYPAYFESKVAFNTVLHNRNSLDEIVEYFNTEFGKTPTINELNISGVSDENKNEFDGIFMSYDATLNDSINPDELIKKLGSNGKIQKELFRYIQRYSGRYFEDYLDLLRNRDLATLPTGTCIPFSRKIFVTVNKDILPCERISHEYIMGQINPCGVNLDYGRCAAIFNSLLSRASNLCKHCFNKRGYVQCVYNVQNCDIGKRCDGYMNEVQFKKYEDMILKYLVSHPDIYKSLLLNSIII